MKSLKYILTIATIFILITGCQNKEVQLLPQDEMKDIVDSFTWEQSGDTSYPVSRRGGFMQADGYALTKVETSIYYKGEMNEKNRPEGFGSLWKEVKVADKEVFMPYYVGFFLGGEQTGYGKMYIVDEETLTVMLMYEGDFEAGRFEGQGLYYDFDRDDFDKHRQQASESLKNKSALIEHGGFIEDPFEFSGYLFYDGHFSENEFQGKGKMFYANGNLKYEGDFIMSQYEGEGILKDETGKIIHQGFFSKGRVAGQ